jgi:hypothetical protein
MECKTLLAMTPKDSGPFSETQVTKDFFDAYCRWILAAFYRWFISDQERILSLNEAREDNNTSTPGEDNIPPIPNMAADVEDHLKWFDRYGEIMGYNLATYAPKTGRGVKTLYNNRSDKGYSKQKQRKSGNRRK